ncbi:TfoX/Sxy family DNA transformation protein [Haemophilus parahaemolyticus]
MQPIRAVVQPISTLFDPIIGKIRLKTHFSYYGIHANGFMIALYKNDMVFIRASHETKTDIQQLEGTYVLQDPEVGLNTKNFYAIPYDTALTNPLFAHWVRSILNELAEQYEKEQEKRKTQIRSLTNMNFKMERILKKINIKNVEQFKQKGYMNTFIELIKQGTDSSDLMLFKLHGAIHQKSIYHITREERKELLLEANQAFYDAGLRHRFDIPNDD